MTGTVRALLQESNYASRRARRAAGARLNTQADLVVARPEGLYCPPGDFYIDPWRPVERAVITHAHGDHARIGPRPLPRGRSRREGVLRTRLGRHRRCRRCRTARRIDHHGVRSRCIRPATCSARRRCGSSTAGGSGSRRATTRLEPGPRTCAPFEPVRCDTFITESTFGLPIYRWRAAARACSPTSTPGGARNADAGPRQPCCSATRSARRSASSRASIRAHRPDRRATARSSR